MEGSPSSTVDDAEQAVYRVVHRTSYRYAEPVSFCRNQLRLRPRALTTSRIVVEPISDTIRTRPHVADRHQHVDVYGNRVSSFAIESPHDRLTVESRFRVRLSRRSVRSDETTLMDMIERLDRRQDQHWLSCEEFRHPSPLVTWDHSMAAFASGSVATDQPIVDALADLTRTIHKDFRYDPVATNVMTPPTASFAERAGVCQDFAHVQIALLRSLGIPARYVSGYLRTEPPPGKERLVGADQSHAWLSVYTGQTHGWLDLDPTNGCIVGLDHVPIAIGRDYTDVAPMKGVVLGGGKPAMRVEVDVERVDSTG